MSETNPHRMSEVDEIERDLSAAVNSWLNGSQQLQFARLLAIARESERRRTPTDPNDPTYWAERNRPGSSFELPNPEIVHV